MMRMRKDNVERIAETQGQISRLKAAGFCEMEPVAEKPADSSERNLETMTVSELKVLAKERGIEGAASLNKAELLEVMKEVV